MLELELANINALLLAFKPGEKDGSPHTDLTISVAETADVLAFFEPTLKSMLFDHAGPRDLAEGMPLRDKHLVFPLKRDEEMHNATVIIDYGVSEKIRLEATMLSKFELTPREGGAVVVEFTVRCRPDPHKDVPYLYILQKRGITITLIPGEPEELPKMQEAA